MITTISIEEFDSVYRELSIMVGHLIGSSVEAPARTEGLLETLFSAYARIYETENIPAILDIVRLRTMLDAEAIFDTIRLHKEGSVNYVHAYDWLYSTPEVAMIADLALSAPRMLKSVFKGSDFENIIASMSDEFRSMMYMNRS